jgi:hypothetical protein
MPRLRLPTLSRLTLAVAALTALAGLVFLVYGVGARPYTAIEAEIVFQVDRLQHHLPLYTDPAEGAWEMGEPPSRYNVLYPPLWLELLARVPTHSLVGTRTFARAMSVALLLFSLVIIVRGARRENRDVVLVGALLTLGLEMVVRGAGLASTDLPAISLSIAGLVRANRKGRIDVASAVMLAMAPFVKHAVLGVTIGAFAAHVLTNRKSGLRSLATPLLAAALTGFSFVAYYHWLSGGVWLLHLVRATGQSLSFERWVHTFANRVALLGLPHAVVLILAIRRRAPLLAIAPLGASLAWTILTLAKHGSTTHYWLEPSLAALVAVGVLPRRPARAWRPLGLALAVAVAVSSLPAFARVPAIYRQWPQQIADVRSACSLSSGQTAMSNDVRVEVELDDRVIIPAWQTSHMARSGNFPIEKWRADLLRPAVRCLVTAPDFFDAVPTDHAGEDVDAYRRELRRDVEEAFVPPISAGGFLIWRKRTPDDASLVAKGQSRGDRLVAPKQATTN